MIRNNLKVILAENNVRISKLANDTGIARSTITALSENRSKGIQLDTMNTLCKYLQVTPSDLFVYAPIDITPSVFDMRVIGYKKEATQDYNIKAMEIHCTLFLNFDTGIEKFSEEFNATGKYINDDYGKIIFNFTAIDDTATQLKAKSIIDNLPTTLRNDVYQAIRETLSHELDTFSKENELIEWAQLLDLPTVNIEFLPW
ncbi:helix-turn-helix transcriptional regulator [uncultured Veillonella sp.]|uniref:helix-turn-helix domain-containing protein n=1 Tax=uncultured Veillonella sp. TaxID=159268 RepID=UPI00266B7B3C|nr:helix-turn-helix transcriptional regulator [uncultured Veillonella sp.]